MEAALKDLPDRMTELFQKSQAFQDAASSLLEQVEARGAEAVEWAGQVEEVAGQVQEQAAGQTAALEGAMDAVNEGADAAAQAIRDAQEQVSDEAEQAGDGMSVLESELSSGGADVEVASAETSQALAALGETVRAGQDGLEAAFESAKAEADALRQAGEEAQDALTQAAGALRGRITELLDQARQQLADTAGQLRELQSAHEAQIETQDGRLADGAEDLSQTVEDRLEADLKQAVSGLVDALVGSLGALSTVTSQTKDVVDAEGEALNAFFEGLLQEMEPMPGAVESVKQAAQTVGIAWGGQENG